MPFATEFTIHLDDQPGTLGEVCRALADRDVNIIGFQSNPVTQGRNLVQTMKKSEAQGTHSLELGR